MLPVDYEFGYVVGRAVLAAPDGTDADRFPDGKSVTGKAVFKPSVDARVTDDYSALVVTPTYEAEFCRPLVPGRVLFPPGTLVDAQEKAGIWLPVGVYTVSLQIEEATVNAFQIEVTTAHTEAAPLDLFQAAPPMPGSGVVFVTVQVPAGGSPTETLVRDTDGQLVWSPVPEGPEGPQGLPGVNAVPGDEAVAGYISTEGTSASQAAVDSRILGAVTTDGPVKDSLKSVIGIDENGKLYENVLPDEGLAGKLAQVGPFREAAIALVNELSPRVNVIDHGVVGDGVSDDTGPMLAAITEAINTDRVLWIPPGLAGVRLTDSINARYLNILWESRVIIDHSTGVGVVLGGSSVKGTPQNISWREIRRATPDPVTPSVRIIGIRSGEIWIGSTDYLQLYADGAVLEDASISYASFHFNAQRVNFLEFLGVNGAGWINDNKFFGGRLTRVRFAGSYAHNGNKFYGPTVENSVIEIETGSDNHFLRVRAEDGCDATFAAGTWANVIETTYTSSASNISSGVNVVLDNGIDNVTTSSLMTYMSPVELVRFDSTTKIHDESSEHPGPFTPIPGIRQLRVRASNQEILDTGVLPLEQLSSSSSDSDVFNVRLDHLVVASSHKLWRPRLYCYNANRELMAPVTGEHILHTGGWNAGTSSYIFSSPMDLMRIVVINRDVKYLRLTLSSSVTGQPSFDWLSLTGFTKSPDSDGVVNTWRRALTRPLFQSSKPVEGLSHAGSYVGEYLCVSREETVLASSAVSGSNTVVVESNAGISPGDLIGVLLAGGDTHWTEVGAVSGSSITLVDNLPSSSNVGGDVITNRWV